MPNVMTLDMDCWPDELSDAQLAAYKLAETEHKRITGMLGEIVSTSGSRSIYLGDIFGAYHLSGAPSVELQGISKTPTALRRDMQQQQKQFGSSSARKRTSLQQPQGASITYATIDDDDDNDNGGGNDDDHNDGDYAPEPHQHLESPAGKRASKVAKLAAEKKREAERKAQETAAAVAAASSRSRPGRIPGGVQPVPSVSGTHSSQRPSENNSIGGLSVGDVTRNRKEIVDLTKDDVGGKGASGSAGGAAAADSREVTFNKLQGKTFPSLVVVARPSLRVKDYANDRPRLDATVKSVLMHTSTKFSEWLIQQGLVRSEQSCQVHTGKPLKLGMYSDATKFAYSGGYLWISDCCPTRYVSVFNGSLFEGAPHAPSVLLKLIYHWSCQTNVQNVVQWVKVDNLYVKALYTLLRAVCTVALHQHGGQLGGPGKKVEVGVISLGTTSQDGQQRQVKVEVLGVLDHDGRVVRLRAVEPLTDGDRNYKKRFAKILEPLDGWVHRDSIIQTDLTVDKNTMHTMGFRFVNQSAPAEAKTKSCNANIMDYLRRIVPRMFQNTLSLLSRQIIQQFLDELVWRERYGSTPNVAFDSIVRHIAEQTRLDVKEPLVGRLAKVSQNPFRNWAHLAVKTPPKALRDNFFSGANAASAVITPAGGGGGGGAGASASAAAAAATPGKRGRKRKEPSPEPAPLKKVKEEPRITAAQRKADAAAAASAATASIVASAMAAAAVNADKTVQLEDFYYGIVHPETGPNDMAQPLHADCPLVAQCPQCHATFHTNVALMDHLKRHAGQSATAADDAQLASDDDEHVCRYCLQMFGTTALLERHHANQHAMQTQRAGGALCLICELRTPHAGKLAAHMQKTHVAGEMPYRCGGCAYASSSLRSTVDHFYAEHAGSAALQCPLCMQCWAVRSTPGAGGRTLPANVVAYLEHLRQHVQPLTATTGGDSVLPVANGRLKCSRCTLTFFTAGAAKMHQYAHVGQARRVNAALCSGLTKISKPKSKYNYVSNSLLVTDRYDTVSMVVENGLMCLECDTDLEERSHFPGRMKCVRCAFVSSCQRAMITHTSNCSGLFQQDARDLPNEYHCVCGFVTQNGNTLATHLALCGRRSAYDSAEAALENTVKRNVLDLLGLMRRDGNGDTAEGSGVDDEDAADEAGTPDADADAGTDAADQPMEQDAEQVEEAGADEAPETAAEVDDDNVSANEEIAGDSTAAAGAAAVVAGELNAPAVHDDQHQFNTELSLDDLAAPASVAPPAPGAEPDRTPQLSDEYLSLATPRIAQPAEPASGEQL